MIGSSIHWFEYLYFTLKITLILKDHLDRETRKSPKGLLNYYNSFGFEREKENLSEAEKLYLKKPKGQAPES